MPGEVLAHHAAGDIMRRRHVAKLQFTAVPDHAVAVAHARMESKLRVAEMCLYGFDDLSGLFT